MSKYTTEVRYICENYAQLSESKGYNDIETILSNSWDKVFDFNFPIFDESYRDDLCKKILRHYYTREICEETVGLWKLRLNSRMNEIMPYYNKLYDSELIRIEPLVNMRYNVTGANVKTGTDTINTSDNGTEIISGTRTNVRTGGYTDSDNGTLVRAKTGTETLGMAGDEIDTKTGKITKTKEGKIVDTGTIEGNTEERYEGLGGKVTDINVDLFTDTPQGNVANMGSGYSSGSGATAVPLVGTDTAYLTTAEKTTNEKEDLSKWKRTNGASNDYKKIDERMYGEDDGQGNVTPYKEEEDYGVNGIVNTKSFNQRTDTKTFNTYNNDTKTNSMQRIYNNQMDDETDGSNKRKSDTGLKTLLYGNRNDNTETVTGSKGISDSKLLKEFRETFLNIDEMIINRLSDLFMLLW